MQSLFFYLVLVPSAIIHEYMHGWVADRLGDPTARNAGRLTLNPIVHIDVWGTILMPLTIFLVSNGSFTFAYAKPVPFNPNNLRDKKRDPMLVAIAGPISNLFLALVFGLFIRFVPLSMAVEALVSTVVYVNVLLAVFNLVPIPPLDGSKVLFAVLPDSLWKFRVFLEKYGMYLLLLFILFFFQWLVPVISQVYFWFTGNFLF